MLAGVGLAAVLAVALAACAAEPERKRSLFGSLSLAPVAFHELPGWQLDNHRAALITFVTTCRRFERLNHV